MSYTATNIPLMTAGFLVLACAQTGTTYEIIGQMCDHEERYVAVEIATKSRSNPVDELYSQSFLTQRDADELRALDQQKLPTARGKILRTRP